MPNAVRYDILLGTLCLLTSCAQPQLEGRPPAASEGDEAAPSEAALRTGQIVHALDVIDADQIAQARVAVWRANEPRVREFAQRVMAQHEQSKRQTIELSRKTGDIPELSTVSGQLEAGGAALVQRLERATSVRVDATYLQTEIARHTTLLRVLREQLLPSVTDTALAARLGAEQRVLQDELSEAQKLQTALAPVTQPARSLL